MIMTLQVDASAIAGQMRIAAEVTKRYLPLLEQLPRNRVENLVGNMFVELKAIIFSYNVTTVLANGTRKRVRTLRYRGAIEDFTAAFWARELNGLH